MNHHLDLVPQRSEIRFEFACIRVRLGALRNNKIITIFTAIPAGIFRQPFETFYELQFIISRGIFFHNVSYLACTHTRPYRLFEFIPSKTDIIAQISSLTLGFAIITNFPLANRSLCVSSLSFSKDYPKSIFCLCEIREKTFQLISQKLQFLGWQMPAERMKERRVPFRIANVIGSFVCCSINCTYQILSAFICLLCAQRRHNGWKETKDGE